MLPEMRQVPLMIPCIFLILGIFGANKFNYTTPPLVLLGIIFLILSALGLFLSKRDLHSTAILFLHLLFNAFLFACIGAYFFLHTEQQLRDKNEWLEKEQLYIGKIQQCKPSGKFKKCEVKIYATNENQSYWKKNFGNVLVYLKNKPKISIQSHQGILLLKSKFNLIKPPVNKYSFDARSFYKTQKITHQSYVDTKDWILAQNESKSTFGEINQLRLWLKNKLSQRVSIAEHCAIATALILGDKSRLSETTSGKFRNTGAMHVLAVSGLHVGMISMLSIFFFKCLTIFQSKLISIQRGGAIIFTWIYAIITGFAPAVQRASIMSNLYLASPILNINRHAHPLNILALAALIILLFNPLSVFTISFQLSFAALLGILILFHPFLKLVRTRFLIPNYLWSLTSLSFAAQIFIAPVLIYYFHEFPVYFWLSSLIAVPLAFVILSSGICFLALDRWLQPLGDIFLFILNHSIEFLITSLASIERLPYGNIKDLWLEPQSLVLYFLILLFLILYNTRAKKLFLWLSIVAIIFLFIYETAHQFQLKHRSQILLYHLKGGSLIDLYINGDRWTYNHNISQSSESYIAENARFKFSSIKSFRIAENTSVNIPYKECYISFRSTSEFVSLRFVECQQEYKDLVILKNPQYETIKWLLKTLPNCQFILDGSNSKNIKEQLDSMDIDYLETISNGLITLKL